MITLLGSLLGFISSIFPDIFKAFRDRSDKQHELAIMQLQIQQAQLVHEQKLAEIGAQADIAESQAIYRTYKTGINWVDALNGTVRPVITYAFFFLYAFVKYGQYLSVGHNAPLGVYLDFMWNAEDQAIFAGIMSFYFGNRAMSKMRGK